jgi:hypothetical protein
MGILFMAFGLLFSFLDDDRGLQQIQRAALDPPPHIVHHPRRQRPGLLPGEVRVCRLQAGFPGPPHLSRRRRPPPGQCPGHLGFS